MSELVAGLIGVIVGGWIGLSVSKEELVFDRRVRLVSEFLRKAYRYTGEHLSPAVDQPENVGAQKQELVLMAEEVRLLLPNDADEAIAEWIDLYHRGLTLVSDPGDPVSFQEQAQIFDDVNGRLKRLRNDLKAHVSGSWLGHQLRNLREWWA